MTNPPEGWYADPTAPGQERWWDGAAWSTELIRPESPAPVPGEPQFAPEEPAPIPIGWYPIEGDPDTERFYDGTDWTMRTRSSVPPPQGTGDAASSPHDGSSPASEPLTTQIVNGPHTVPPEKVGQWVSSMAGPSESRTRARRTAAIGAALVVLFFAKRRGRRAQKR